MPENIEGVQCWRAVTALGECFEAVVCHAECWDLLVDGYES
jgi:hypothetical protein